MRRIVLVLSWLLSVASTANASEIVSGAFASEVLAREYTYLVYLPDAYQDDENVRLPVLYLLHGSFSSAEFWTEGVGVATKLDQLIHEGAIPPALVVMPNANSWWVDGLNEKAETAFIEELLPHIEQRWRGSSARQDRLLAGVSAGGFGAVNFAMKFPDLLAAGAAMSPASYDGLPPERSSAYRHPAFVDADGMFDEGLWGSVNYPALIERYRSQDVIVPLYINSGDHDEFDIAYHATVLYQRLREYQPQHVELRIVDGGHETEVWARTFNDAVTFLFSNR